MNSIILEGFRQIVADEELCDTYSTSNLLSALNKNGVTLINDMSVSVTSVCRGSQTVNSVERTGLIFTTSSSVMLYCTLPDLKDSAVQMGFRLTLSDGKKYSSTPSHIGVNGYSFTTPYPDEAASYYYEIFVARDEKGYVQVSLYCNRSLAGNASFYASDSQTGNIQVRIGSGTSVFASGVSGTFMLGDMYCLPVAYGNDHASSPTLLGSIEVRCSAVSQFSGSHAQNSLNKEIVIGLNTSDSSTGYLLLSPSQDAAKVTFENVDNSKGSLIAVQAAVTLQEAASPNNLLAWSVGCGSSEGDVISETEAVSDTASWTTVTQGFMTTPGNTTAFETGSLVFTSNLYNREKTDQEVS
ncbi:hypothetical protein CTY41_22645 [Escherichia coli]|uniref:hypothetical protein n=1 Tax=Escherichia coli TaxID=562 RepID=UPI000C24A3AE|nr:hypothetical protein [Escherichia coli]PJI61371.1 hypothetical protein CTY41_22645 [Escherichia coli]